jgi:hypothetical protein
VNISGTVYKDAGVWLDSQGLPRRIVLRFKQQVIRDDEAVVGYQLDLGAFGGPVHISVPSPDVTAQYPDLPEMLAAEAQAVGAYRQAQSSSLASVGRPGAVSSSIAGIGQ